MKVQDIKLINGFVIIEQFITDKVGDIHILRQEDPQMGTVVSSSIDYIPVGTDIIHKITAGEKMKFEDKEYKLLTESDILAIITK